ncbi:amphi-Trp domain-containing protein [Haloplanus ruber]|uniref:Amphi-Trp domain-containing protein n=1 Tax=Haloplanus ruber TaxID=869892 RepID=A0ABD6CWS9_9EURY|nr:amphi-Trp domain-containing protein [Haloplanus ruber]
MAELPTDDTDHDDAVTDDFFTREYGVSAAHAGEFLVELGEQLQSGDGDVTISGDDWEIPFTYGEPVELEIEFVGGADAELEIEVELSAARDGEMPSLG